VEESIAMGLGDGVMARFGGSKREEVGVRPGGEVDACEASSGGEGSDEGSGGAWEWPGPFRIGIIAGIGEALLMDAWWHRRAAERRCPGDVRGGIGAAGGNMR
jgi:hypothetical protein